MSGLKIKQVLSGLAHFYAVCCGEVHFPVLKSDIGCLKLMQRIRHRRSFLPAADSRWQEFWQLGLEV